MTPKDYWTLYAEDAPPAKFVWTFGKGNLDVSVDASVEEYLCRRPHLYGIVRRSTWKETFQAREQHNRSCVATGLKAFLEETKQAWISEVVAFAEAEAASIARVKAETQARMLEEAMARVEAEAQRRLAASESVPPADSDAISSAPPASNGTESLGSPAAFEDSAAGQAETPDISASEETAPPLPDA